MTITPVALTLIGLLIAAISALIAGGVAWGKFSSALDELRKDQALLREDVRRGQADGAHIAVMTSRVSTLEVEVKSLRENSHKQASMIATFEARIDSLRSAVERAMDRASNHPERSLCTTSLRFSLTLACLCISL